MSGEPKWAAYTVFVAVSPSHKPPTPSSVEWAIQQLAGVQTATASQDCEPCARFGSHHPCHPGETAHPDSGICEANLRLRLDDFAKRAARWS